MASSTVIVSSTEQHESPSPSTEDDKSLLEQFRKLFIGGLSYSTTDEKLK